MNTASITCSASEPIWAPLQELWSRLISGFATTPAHPTTPAAGSATRAAHNASSTAHSACTARTTQRVASPIKPKTHRPLRVVRVLDTNQVGTDAGRLLICGSIADVCAELDRLAACETTRH